MSRWHCRRQARHGGGCASWHGLDTANERMHDEITEFFLLLARACCSYMLFDTVPPTWAPV